MCVCVLTCAYERRYLRRPEEGDGPLEEVVVRGLAWVLGAELDLLEEL